MAVAIKFEGNQNYQIEAIEAVTGLFEGFSEIEATLDGALPSFVDNGLFQESLFGNRMPVSDRQLHENLRAVQAREIDDPSGTVRVAVPIELQQPATLKHPARDFSIEMETGTGKTYVYIRTAIELYLKHGIRKFVIVVPSIAIREGVLTSLRLTKDHFRELYSGIQYDAYAYSSKNVTKLRQFATSSHLEILVMNVQAFSSDLNIIKRPTDQLSGFAPIQFIEAVQPVLIMDEPQKLGGEKAAAAISALNPLFSLRYSATHKDLHHLLYRLTPIDAYQRELVKQIEVLSVTADRNENVAYVSVEKVTASKTSVTATLKVNKKSGKNKSLPIKRNTDLEDETGLPIYKGWVVEDIRVTDYGNVVEFQNGVQLFEGDSTGVEKDLLHRAQLRAAVHAHFETELRLLQARERGAIQEMKPLTLFFIDHVKSYAPDSSKLKKWFAEEYEAIKADRKYALLSMPDAGDAHKGYFASKKGIAVDSKEKANGDSSAQDAEAFELIMVAKERLLSPEEPVRFIFSHSALAEGWDNPNVFVICNLQEVKSTVRRRQQLGRGLRLPVMVDGERCRLRDYNRLIVIASEEFQQYADGLQVEIAEESGIKIPPGYVRKHDSRKRLKLKKDFELDPAFQELWTRIAPRTRYRLSFTSEELIKRSVEKLKKEPNVPRPVITMQGQIIDEIGEHAEIVGGRVRVIAQKYQQAISFEVPDVLKELSSRLPVSRATIFEVIERSGRKGEIARNPSVFVDQVHRSIRDALAGLLMDKETGLQYRQIEPGPESEWDAQLFYDRIPEVYEDTLVSVKKSIYEEIPCDSKIERAFAEAIDQMDDVELFVKLPDWFKIDTPVGGYNPDWAIVMKDESGRRELYLVRETKGTAEKEQLFREPEKWKVTFGSRHFQAIKVDYDMIKTADQI